MLNKSAVIDSNFVPSAHISRTQPNVTYNVLLVRHLVNSIKYNVMLGSDPLAPLCENMMTSTKPKVIKGGRTEPELWPETTRNVNLKLKLKTNLYRAIKSEDSEAKFGHVAFEIRKQTNRQINKHTNKHRQTHRHADLNDQSNKFRKARNRKI